MYPDQGTNRTPCGIHPELVPLLGFSDSEEQTSDVAPTFTSFEIHCSKRTAKALSLEALATFACGIGHGLDAVGARNAAGFCAKRNSGN
jgi:hypothetical protein